MQAPAPTSDPNGPDRTLIELWEDEKERGVFGPDEDRDAVAARAVLWRFLDQEYARMPELPPGHSRAEYRKLLRIATKGTRGRPTVKKRELVLRCQYAGTLAGTIHRAALCGYAAARMPDEWAPEERARIAGGLTSRITLKLLTGDLVPSGKLLPFLFGVMNNLVQHARRDAGRFVDIDAEVNLPPAPGPGDAFDACTRMRAADAVDTELDALDPEDRYVAEAVFVDGAKAREVATETGKSTRAIESKAFRLRQRFRSRRGLMRAWQEMR